MATNLDELLSDTQKFFQATSLNGNTLNYSIDEEVPRWILTDPLRLTQILNNLISNSNKFTDNGVIQVNVSLAGPIQGDGKVKLGFVVKDNGCGIDPKRIPSLFEPFTQADLSTTRKFGGTGLGLAITKELSEAFERQHRGH